MASYIKSVRATKDTTLLLDGGDMSVGTIWDIVYKSRDASAAFQNYMKVDAFVSYWQLFIKCLECTLGERQLRV